MRKLIFSILLKYKIDNVNCSCTREMISETMLNNYIGTPVMDSDIFMAYSERAILNEEKINMVASESEMDSFFIALMQYILNSKKLEIMDINRRDDIIKKHSEFILNLITSCDIYQKHEIYLRWINDNLANVKEYKYYAKYLNDYLIPSSVISEMTMLRNLEIIGLERMLEDGDLEGLNELKYLADVKFIGSNLDGDNIEFILNNLPYLEKLEIVNKSKLNLQYCNYPNHYNSLKVLKLQGCDLELTDIMKIIYLFPNLEILGLYENKCLFIDDKMFVEMAKLNNLKFRLNITPSERNELHMRIRLNHPNGNNLKVASDVGSNDPECASYGYVDFSNFIRYDEKVYEMFGIYESQSKKTLELLDLIDNYDTRYLDGFIILLAHIVEMDKENENLIDVYIDDIKNILAWSNEQKNQFCIQYSHIITEYDNKELVYDFSEFEKVKFPSIIMSKMTNLKKLTIHNYNSNKNVIEFEHLKDLEYLSFIYPTINEKSISEIFKYCKNLNGFVIDSNYNELDFSEIKFDQESYPYVKLLVLNNCGILEEELDIIIGLFNNLEELYLLENLDLQISERIIELKNLRNLFLSRFGDKDPYEKLRENMKNNNLISSFIIHISDSIIYSNSNSNNITYVPFELIHIDNNSLILPLSNTTSNNKD